jgi:hypothetical protein
MESDEVLVANEEPRLITNPRPILIVGVAAGVLGCLLLKMEGDLGTVLGLVVLGIGLLATGIAVTVSPRSPVVLGTAAFVALVASLTTHPRWDSVGLLFGVMAGIAGLSALLMLLPQTVRRVIISVFILFHFGGILTAVTSVESNAWISQQLWTRVYRPYLQFFYLINAYHFYSPEPGPAQQLWFRVAYTDEAGKAHGHWYRIPNRDAVPWWDPLAHSYQRRLSLTEMTQGFTYGNATDDSPTVRRRRSVLNDYPFSTEMLPPQQYCVPIPDVEKMLQSYARHVWWLMEERHPDWHIRGVRIYRVRHAILSASAYDPHSEHYLHPYSPVTFLPYYLGEYDRDGKLKDPDDPMLCWHIPIMRVPLQDTAPSQTQAPLPFRAIVPQAPTPPPQEPREGEYKIINYLKRHAGDQGAEEPLPPFDGEWK